MTFQALAGSMSHSTVRSGNQRSDWAGRAVPGYGSRGEEILQIAREWMSDPVQATEAMGAIIRDEVCSTESQTGGQQQEAHDLLAATWETAQDK